MIAFYLYLCIANILGFLLFGLDKMFAILKSRRIPEKVLLAICALGGSLGCIVGMVLFHHKTSKPRFRYFVPICFFIYLLAIIYITYFL